MKRVGILFKSLLLSLLTINVYAGTIATENLSDTNKVELITPPAKTITQLGLAVEQRAAYVDAYAFINQLFKDRLFYELRAYYVYDYMTVSPPTTTPQPDASDENTVNGTGVVGILGYNFKINPKVTLMPFTRLQYLTNTFSNINFAPYEDSFGNSVKSDNYTAYLGLKLSMDINEVFAIYAQYYAGYQWNILYGRGYWDTDSTPQVNALVSTLELDLPYKLTPSWIFMPYIQWNTASNKPNSTAVDYPYGHDSLTTTGAVFALRLGYKFA